MEHHDSRGSLWALLLGTVSFALCFTVWGLVAPLAPLFRDAYALSTTQVGLLVATPVLLGSVFRIPAGMLTDRYGGRIVFPALMLLLVPTVALAAVSQSFAMLLAAAFLLGKVVVYTLLAARARAHPHPHRPQDPHGPSSVVAAPD